jgi:hypothetical protein
MANGKNGNGKNGTTKPGDGEGNAPNGKPTAEPNGVRSGNGVKGPTWEVTPPPSPTAIVVPTRSLTPLIVTAATLALGGGAVYAVHRWRQRQLPEGETAPLPESGGAAPTPTPAPAPAQPGDPAPPAGNSDASFWGTTTRGEVYRPLLTKIEAVTAMPLRLYLCVVANREGQWVRSARNKSKKEVGASRDGVDNGIKRGNPAPKFATSIREAGSGGLFGALAPFVAWTGLDEDYMPYLDQDWMVIEDPIVSAIFAAKYYQRIVGGGRYPVHANPASPAPEDNYRVRLGWASPKALKEDPNGSLFQDVKKRFDEDLAQLGLKISDLPPPNADRWPGLKAVVAAMKDFPVTWK